MRGSASRMVFVVWATPHPGVGAEFDRWYDEVHGPDALANGSFLAMHRYRAVGPGYRAAPYLAVWEADFASEAEAWAYITPRAQELRARGRVEDLYRVDWATMMLAVDATVAARPTTTLTTVQNDWREPGGDAAAWAAGVAAPAVSHSTHAFTTDPAGARGAGRHLVLHESEQGPGEVAAAWAGVGAAGSSPLPPYTTMFGQADDRDRSGEPDPAPCWVAHWEPVTSMRR